MGRPSMTIEGTVVRGEGLGAELGFPTANVAYDVPPPAKGVFAVTVDGPGLSGQKAVCNIGTRPTVSGSTSLVVEVHIPGWSGDLYGVKLAIKLVRKLRDEKKFASLNELKAQIAADVASLG